MYEQPSERVCLPLSRSPAAGADLRRRYAAPLDFVAQQAAWWGAVLLVRSGFGTAAAFPSLLVVAVAVALRGRTTLVLAALAGTLGFAIDTLLVQQHAISFPAEPNAQLTSVWMVALWCALGTALTKSLAWLHARNPAFIAAVGGGAGLFAYRGGASLGVLRLADAPGLWLAIFLGWSLAIMALCLVARRLQRATSQVQP